MVGTDELLAADRECAALVHADRTRLESVDLAATVVQLQQAENACTAALGAVSRALQLPSLADLLR